VTSLDGPGPELNATPSDLAAVPSPYTPPATPARRLSIAVPVVGVLIVAGLLMVDRATYPAPLPPPVAVPAPAIPKEPPPPAPARVTYEVTAIGSDNTGSVSFTDQDGDIIRRNGIPLPWRTTFTIGDRPPLVLHAQRKDGGDNGPVTCTITLDGKVLSSSTEKGRYAAPQCG
jgi:hypothetical protein